MRDEITAIAEPEQNVPRTGQRLVELGERPSEIVVCEPNVNVPAATHEQQIHRRRDGDCAGTLHAGGQSCAGGE